MHEQKRRWINGLCEDRAPDTDSKCRTTARLLEAIWSLPSRCCHHGEGRSQDFLKNSKRARIEEYRQPSVSLVIGGSVATIAGAAHPAKPPKRLSHRPGWDAFWFSDCWRVVTSGDGNESGGRRGCPISLQISVDRNGWQVASAVDFRLADEQGGRSGIQSEIQRFGEFKKSSEIKPVVRS